MAHKYCRYCAHCISGDAYYCTEFDKVLYNVKSAVNCSKFVLSTLGDVDTGKSYKPREAVTVYNDSMQLTLEGAKKMREILFREKIIGEDKWVQGYYVCLNCKAHQIYTGYAETDRQA